MCRAIKPLYNFEPPANENDVRAAALQYVRKISGFTHPSRANQATFQAAVEAITAVSCTLLENLVTSAPPRSRLEFESRARIQSTKRFQLKQK